MILKLYYRIPHDWHSWGLDIHIVLLLRKIHHMLSKNTVSTGHNGQHIVTYCFAVIKHLSSCFNLMVFPANVWFVMQSHQIRMYEYLYWAGFLKMSWKWKSIHKTPATVFNVVWRRTMLTMIAWATSIVNWSCVATTKIVLDLRLAATEVLYRDACSAFRYEKVLKPLYFN